MIGEQCLVVSLLKHIWVLLLFATAACTESTVQKPSSRPVLRASGEGERAARLTRTASSVTVLSGVHVVDRLYPSMTGPKTKGGFQITEDDKPELIWITGYEATMKSSDGRVSESQQYMCHSNLDWAGRLPGFQKNRNNKRVFTLSQGQLSLQLPFGFGIPMSSTEWLDLTTQVLNMHQHTGRKEVRHQTTIRFVRDEDGQKVKMRPLTYRTTAIRVSLEDDAIVFNELNPTKLQKEASCLPGQDADQGNRPSFDKKGRRYSAHWMVPPGRHRFRTLATPELNLKQDTLIHYIAVHAHPFVDFVEFRDLTANESVFRSNARNVKDSIGIDHIDHFSSTAGKPIFKDHEYEIVTEYNNTSGKAQDAMAVMYLYLYDADFESPLRSATPSPPSKEQIDIGGIKFLRK